MSLRIRRRESTGSMCSYFLARRRIRAVKVLKEKGGLDNAKWFRFKDIIDLNFYDDMLPIVTEAVQKLLDHANCTADRIHAHA